MESLKCLLPERVERVLEKEEEKARVRVAVKVKAKAKAKVKPITPKLCPHLPSMFNRQRQAELTMLRPRPSLEKLHITVLITLKRHKLLCNA